jgi:hypothetical protein
MKKLIVIFTMIIILLSAAASIAGTLSYRNMNFQMFTTVRGEQVEIQTAGIYQYSVKPLVVAGISFDVIRLAVGIPLLIISFILFLKSSLRGTLIYIGVLANFFYQYLLWTFNWAYNPLYLAYVILYSLSLVTVLLVFKTFALEKSHTAVRKSFPVLWAAVFSFVVGGLLALKCLGEIVPTIVTNTLPSVATGYYTIIDQGIDLGLILPFCILVGILLLKRNIHGYLLSTVSIILFLNLGLSIIAGSVVEGLSSGNMPIPGIAMFSLFCIIGVVLLVFMLRNIEDAPITERK